jgi:hypothetical protein
MENYNPASAVYLRDHTLPYWRNNVDAESIFQAFAHRPEKAKAWLRYRNVSDTCSGFERAVIMHGHFEGGILNNHTYAWTFTPGRRSDLAIVVPVQNDFVGGSDDASNLHWLCHPCHSRKTVKHDGGFGHSMSRMVSAPDRRADAGRHHFRK